MGISNFTYLGPYIEARNSQENVTEKHRSCVYALCPKYKNIIRDDNVKFCTSCGSTIGETNFNKTKPKINAWEIAERYDLSIKPNSLSETTEIFVGNRAHKGRKFCFEANEERNLEITAQLIFDEIFEFIKNYEKSINALYDAYGNGNVLIKWGLIQYSS